MMVCRILTLGVRQFECANMVYLWLVFMVPPLILIYLYGSYMRKHVLRKFAVPAALRTIARPASPQRHVLRAAVMLLAVLLIVFALMRPRGDPEEKEVKEEGRDVCFLLDASKSMLAKDLLPNRLERAKLAIKDMVNAMNGDRVGLIIFAGSVDLKCPLTSNYHFFNIIVDNVTTEDVSRGGTNVGDAIRKAVNSVLGKEETEYQDIILISDGEDLQGSFPVEAAKYAAQKGIRIHTVGLGSPDGTILPDPDKPNDEDAKLLHDGEPVISRLDDRTLRNIAAATPGGSYLPVHTGTTDFGKFYQEDIAASKTREHGGTLRIEWTEWFQAPLIAAVILLIIEWLLGERKRVRKEVRP